MNNKLKVLGNINIKAVNDEFKSNSGIEKIDINTNSVNHLLSFIPEVIATDSLTQAYSVTFPEGLPHTLTQLKQGGFGSMIRGEDGKILGSASFHQMTSSAALLGAFTAMAAVSGQYFLKEINDELKIVRYGIDDILKFLYGDKKAELLSELIFVKYAHENYGTIILNDEQKTATLTNLQSSRKVAMKDIEFYISDLDELVNSREYKDGKGLNELSGKAFSLKNSLELAVQLYAMSSVLEIYYSQNTDKAYLKYFETELFSYIDKCEKRILSNFSILSSRIKAYRFYPLEKDNRVQLLEPINQVIDNFNTGEESKMRKSFRNVLNAINTKTEFFICKDGQAYLKTS